MGCGIEHRILLDTIYPESKLSSQTWPHHRTINTLNNLLRLLDIGLADELVDALDDMLAVMWVCHGEDWMLGKQRGNLLEPYLVLDR